MTLIEVMLALALLGVLVGVGTTWITTSSRLALEQSNRLHWQRSAEALIQAIHDDLLLGDFEPARDNARVSRRVQLNGSTLSIRTRANAHPTRRIYRFDPTAGDIRTWLAPPDARIPGSIPADAAIVLAGVVGMDLLIDEEYSLLDVTIEGPERKTVHRQYRIGEIP